MQNLTEAGELARWLIEEQGCDHKKAYIIAARKFGIENWHDVQKYYNQEVKTKQLELL